VSDQGNGGLSFGAGFFLGAVVGAILGLIFAPQPGKQTREMLKTKGDELTARARESWHEKWLQGKEAATKAGAELREKLEQARGKQEAE